VKSATRHIAAHQICQDDGWELPYSQWRYGESRVAGNMFGKVGSSARNIFSDNKMAGEARLTLVGKLV
jgi:hypothetical protein